MKSKCLQAILFICISAGFSSVAAQTLEIAVLDATRKAVGARSKSGATNHRSTMTVEGFAKRGGELVSRRIWIREISHPKRLRSVHINELPSGLPKLEELTIGEEYYRRSGDNAWEKIEPPKFPDHPPMADIVVPFESKAELTDKGMGGTYLRVFRKNLVRRDDNEITHTMTEEFWIDADGRLIREKREIETSDKPEIYITETEYEFGDPRIEAPKKFK